MVKSNMVTRLQWTCLATDDVLVMISRWPQITYKLTSRGAGTKGGPLAIAINDLQV
jgi:hypothetical protein